MRHIRIVLILLAFCHIVPMFAQREKMSAYLRRLTMQHTALNQARQSENAKLPKTTVLIKTNNPGIIAEQESLGACLLRSWNNIHALVIPIENLKQLAAKSEVLRIEANEPCMLTNDTTAHVTHVQHNPFYSLTSNEWGNESGNDWGDVRTEFGLTGKGVVVGVMDIGFDLTHPSYLSPTTGESRIRAVWDQLDQSEDGEEMAVGRSYTTPQQLSQKQHTADAHLSSHGTHTSNTAAGSGLEGMPSVSSTDGTLSQSIYTGMAPEADLCLVCNIVSTNKEVVPEDQHQLYTTATDLLGFQYIFDHAESIGQPCVISFSEGQHQDLDENQLYNEVLSQMVGPGRILCSSAGNEGQKGSYLHKSRGTQQAGAFLTANSNQAYYTLRSEQATQIKLTFYDQDGSTTEWNSDAKKLTDHPDSLFVDTVSIADTKCAIHYITYPSCFDPDKLATELLIQDIQAYNIGTSRRTVSMQVSGEDNDIEVFASGGYFTTNDRNPALSDYTLDHNILFPGSAPDAICVGNSSYRTTFLNANNEWCTLFGTNEHDGMLSPHSSVGPTMEGLTKPDVSAPGMNVISALSSWYDESKRDRDADVVSRFNYNGRTYGWWAESGTSMSTPATAGIIALWLELCPTLSPTDIKTIFQHSCTLPPFASPLPNNQYGWGNIDALAGARYINENMPTGITSPKTDGRTFNGRSAGRPGTFDISGRRLSRIKQPGIYIVNGKLKMEN